jgi:hypothetical protein
MSSPTQKNQWARLWNEVKEIACTTGRDPNVLTGAMYMTVITDEDRSRANERLRHRGGGTECPRGQLNCGCGAVPGMSGPRSQSLIKKPVALAKERWRSPVKTLTTSGPMGVARNGCKARSCGVSGCAQSTGVARASSDGSPRRRSSKPRHDGGV